MAEDVQCRDGVVHPYCAWYVNDMNYLGRDQGALLLKCLLLPHCEPKRGTSRQHISMNNNIGPSSSPLFIHCSPLGIQAGGKSFIRSTTRAIFHKELLGLNTGPSSARCMPSDLCPFLEAIFPRNAALKWFLPCPFLRTEDLALDACSCSCGCCFFRRGFYGLLDVCFYW